MSVPFYKNSFFYELLLGVIFVISVGLFLVFSLNLVGKLLTIENRLGKLEGLVGGIKIY